MDETDSTLALKLGLHVFLTSSALGLLTSDAGYEGSDHFVKTLNFFVQNRGLLIVLLNEEPIYLAGRMLGLDHQSIDDLPSVVWDRYQLRSDQVELNSVKYFDPVLFRLFAKIVELDWEQQARQEHKLKPLDTSDAVGFGV